jgi:hypothetical protein
MEQNRTRRVLHGRIPALGIIKKYTSNFLAITAVLPLFASAFKMKVDDIRQVLDQERQSLLLHPLYSRLRDVHSLRVFMEHHVWAVYDFMCLAKRLQASFSSTAFPWTPPKEPQVARLINKIILGKETDVRANGTTGSHFDFYLEAMAEVGANTQPVQRYLQALDAGRTWQGSLQNSGAPAAASVFVRQTLDAIENQSLAYIAGAFTFGRETLIPNMFVQFVNTLEQSHRGKFAGLIDYLERHIEVDSEEHGPLALQMLEKTIEADNGNAEDILEGAQTELLKRTHLWDAVLDALELPLESASAS